MGMSNSASTGQLLSGSQTNIALKPSLQYICCECEHPLFSDLDIIHHTKTNRRNSVGFVKDYLNEEALSQFEAKRNEDNVSCKSAGPRSLAN